MLKDKDIICISSIDWDFIWQGHQEIMSSLAQNGNRILFIENTGVRAPGIKDIPRIKQRIKNWFKGIKGIREEMRNLYVFSPLLLPFPYFRMARWINRKSILSVLNQWIRIMNFNNVIVWTFLPTPLSLEIINALTKKITIYYCIDNFRVSSISAKKILRWERKLLKQADLVFVTSRELQNYCSQYNPKVYYFPFAVNFPKFNKIREAKTDIPDELKDIKRPIIGYVGGIHKWIDIKLIKELVEQYPECSFVFVGPLQTDVSIISDFKNVFFLGNKEHNMIPFFVKSFDICIIPYLITDYTRNVYPTKLNEYLAMGKPVVSTALPEVVNFNIENNNLIFIGRTYKEFIDCISAALNVSNDKLVQERISCAQKNSWSARIEEMGNLIEDAIEKKFTMLFDWRETLLKSYRIARRKIFNLGTIVLGMYFLIFYTPLVWFLASPLRFSQAPQKADCIVVFAGGVGESGKAGQGYEERLHYAVELYKKGYADYLIFSSGYMYIFKEPLIMKAIAVSLGVPQEAIILEDKAKNTYENIRFTKEILDKNSWNGVLLVSSPYHMRRASLVFNEVAKNIKVTYTPIPNSLFYSHPDKDIYGRKVWRRINLRQIRGLFHEYLGILYYWWKGWI